MLPRRCAANEVIVKEAYDHDYMMQLEQQVEALTQWLQAFMTQNQQLQNLLYESGDEGPGGDDFWEAPDRVIGFIFVMKKIEGKMIGGHGKQVYALRY